MTRIYFFGLTILFCSCGQKSASDKSLTVERFIDSTDRSCESITAIRYASVDELLTDFHKTAKYKDSAELNLRLGTFFYQNGQYDTALYYFTESKKIDSTDSDLHFDLGLTFMKKKEYGKALSYINTAKVICGDSEKWIYLSTECYVLGEMNRCDEAITVGLKSFKLNPDNTKVYGNLIRCFDKVGQGDSVKKYVDLAMTRFGETADWMQDLKHKYE